jgi:hypothetical protein
VSDTTVTIWTHDYGPIDVPEPEWCVTDHSPVIGYRADIRHDSREVQLQVRTERHGLLSALPVYFSQRPYSPTDPGVGVTVGFGLEHVGLTAEELRATVDALHKHTQVLEVFARELPKLQEGDR